MQGINRLRKPHRIHCTVGAAVEVVYNFQNSGIPKPLQRFRGWRFTAYLRPMEGIPDKVLNLAWTFFQVVSAASYPKQGLSFLYAVIYAIYGIFYCDCTENKPWNSHPCVPGNCPMYCSASCTLAVVQQEREQRCRILMCAEYISTLLPLLRTITIII